MAWQLLPCTPCNPARAPQHPQPPLVKQQHCWQYGQLLTRSGSCSRLVVKPLNAPVMQWTGHHQQYAQKQPGGCSLHCEQLQDMCSNSWSRRCRLCGTRLPRVVWWCLDIDEQAYSCCGSFPVHCASSAECRQDAFLAGWLVNCCCTCVVEASLAASCPRQKAEHQR